MQFIRVLFVVSGSFSRSSTRFSPNISISGCFCPETKQESFLRSFVISFATENPIDGLFVVR